MALMMMWSDSNPHCTVLRLSVACCAVPRSMTSHAAWHESGLLVASSSWLIRFTQTVYYNSRCVYTLMRAAAGSISWWIDCFVGVREYDVRTCVHVANQCILKLLQNSMRFMQKEKHAQSSSSLGYLRRVPPVPNKLTASAVIYNCPHYYEDVYCLNYYTFYVQRQR